MFETDLKMTAWIVVVLTAIAAFIGYVTVNQIGPQWFWATNLCRDATGSIAATCGTIPGVVMVACVGGAVLIAGGISLLDGETA